MKDFVLCTDEELMQDIKVDNMLAFDILYKKYSKRIYKFAYSILKSAEDSENILQEVFLNLWKNRLQIEKNSSIKYYVFTIAYNSSISIIRKKARESEFFEQLKSIQDYKQQPANLELEYNELSDKFNEVVNNLPERQKEVYLLHKEEGLKYHEIAEQLHISINTVENHMSRALKTIREKIGNYSLITILFYFLFV
jgi:RNA polymerase sigma-70 factor, ECF subfamily